MYLVYLFHFRSVFKVPNTPNAISVDTIVRHVFYAEDVNEAGPKIIHHLSFIIIKILFIIIIIIIIIIINIIII